MEPRFGRDFSGVRVHTDYDAAESASALNARAYTAGRDVVFGAGKYTPSTDTGRSLIAHELTHVVQQSEGPVSGVPIAAGMTVSEPADRFEQAAAASAHEPPVFETPAPLPAPAAGDGVMLQRADEPAKTGAKSAPKGGTQAIQEQQPPSSSPPIAGQGGPNALNPTPLPYERWEKIENRISPELGINFLEIGRVATVDVKQQLYDVFKPYDDDIVDRNQKWASWLGVFTSAAGNAPQDPGPSSPSTPSPTYSITGGLGGAIAQVGQVVVGKILDTGSVGVAKARANLDVEALASDVLTTDSPVFDSFEQDALNEVRSKADLDWKAAQEKFPPEILPEVTPSVYARYVRREFGPHSRRVSSVISQFQQKLKPYLDKVKARLEVLRKLAQRNRKLAAFATGAFAGGIIGGAIGVGVGGSSLGGRVLGGLVGLGAGAIGGAVLGGLAGTIFAGSDKPKDETRSAEDRAKDRQALETIGPDKDEKKEEEEDAKKAKEEDAASK